MCEGIQDSLGFCIQNCRFLDSGFQSLTGIWFLELYHGFQSQGFWIPQEKFSRRIQDSTNNNFQDSGFILWYCSLCCRRWHIFTRFFVKKMIVPHDGFSFFGFDDQVALMTVLSEVALPIFSSRPSLKWAVIWRRSVTSRYHGSKLTRSQQ